MISSSNAYKNQLNTDIALTSRSKIVVDGVEYLSSVIKDAPKIKHSSTKFIGTFPIKTVSFSIYDINGDIDFENKEIEIYKGFVVNNTIEYIKQGIFIPKAENIKTSISDRTITFNNVQDRTQLLENRYSSQLDWSNNQTHTGLEIVQEICTRRNITLKNNNFAFANYAFKQPNFVENITDRGVIAALAEIGGEIAIFDSNGEIEIKGPIDVEHTIQRKRYEKLSYEKPIIINTVVLGKEGMNDDVIYPETIETERVELKLLDNPFVDLYRSEMIEDVANYIIGLSYVPFQIDGFVDGYIYELNDTITIIDKNNNSFEAVILDLENTSKIKSKIIAPKEKNNKTEYNLAGSNKQNFDLVRLDVDHIRGEVRAVATKTDDAYALAEEAKVTVEGLTNTLSSSGGINYIKDSMGVLNDGSWLDNSNQKANIESTNYANAVGQSAIVLNNVLFKQSIQCKNGTYNLSFKFLKSAPTGILTLKINDATYTIDDTGEFSQNINISTNTVDISFVGNVSNTGYIYDLILNEGTEKKQWEQNQDETTTDTVKIGKGIEVRSSSQNTTSKMNADGFKVTSNTSNQDVMKATDKGGWFNELESHSTSNINGVLYTRVGSQTWLTGGDS